jgi:hypothetical protein
LPAKHVLYFADTFSFYFSIFRRRRRLPACFPKSLEHPETGILYSGRFLSFGNGKSSGFQFETETLLNIFRTLV